MYPNKDVYHLYTFKEMSFDCPDYDDVHACSALRHILNNQQNESSAYIKKGIHSFMSLRMKSVNMAKRHNIEL